MLAISETCVDSEDFSVSKSTYFTIKLLTSFSRQKEKNASKQADRSEGRTCSVRFCEVGVKLDVLLPGNLAVPIAIILVQHHSEWQRQ